MARYQYPTGSLLQPFMYTISKEKAHYYHTCTACVIGRHPYFTSNLLDMSKVASKLSEGLAFTCCDTFWLYGTLPLGCEVLSFL